MEAAAWRTGERWTSHLTVACRLSNDVDDRFALVPHQSTTNRCSPALITMSEVVLYHNNATMPDSTADSTALVSGGGAIAVQTINGAGDAVYVFALFMIVLISHSLFSCFYAPFPSFCI